MIRIRVIKLTIIAAGISAFLSIMLTIFLPCILVDIFGGLSLFLCLIGVILILKRKANKGADDDNRGKITGTTKGI